MDNDNIRVIAFDIEEKSELAEKLWLVVGRHEIKITHYRDFSEFYDGNTATDIIFIKEREISKNRYLDDFPLQDYIVFLIYDDSAEPNALEMLAKGASYVFHEDELERPEFVDIFNTIIKQLKNKQMQQGKKQEQAYFQAALSVSPDAMIIFDEKKRIIYASDHYRRVYPSFSSLVIHGMHVEEAFALMSREQEIQPGDPQYDAARDFWYNLKGSAEIPLKNGQTVRLTARKLPDNAGTAVITTNVTKYREQQGQLEEQSLKLENLLKTEQQASEIQKQFISMVSHEFKTPLTIIDGNAQILERRADELTPEIIQKRSKTIRSAVSRLISLMEGVLSSSMIETGTMSIDSTPFDLKELIDELCAEQEDLTPALIISSDLHKIPGMITLDRKMMTLIISNLLSNAVKFSGENPTIEINADIRDGLLLLQFNDNGIGIPDEEQAKIFDRFYRASNTTGITGTGIGLNLVQQLVHILGGSIKLVSVEGEGTTFYLTFPVKDKNGD